MEHAWLDSLSEDWPSLPGSDTSAAQLPPLKNTEKSASKPKATTPSRIPRRAQGSRPQLSATIDSSFNVLSERSSNDINISRQRQSSKLSQQSKHTHIGVSRSVSAATVGSVIHNTFEHNSSPDKPSGDTPEWRRRLLQGKMQYGEQRDLFCNAATGLQDMFKPPSPSNENFAMDDSQQHESTMASSPPQYPQRVVSADLYDLDTLPEIEEFHEEDEQVYPNDLTPSPSPRRAQREIKYRLNVDESMAPSELSHLQSRDNSTPGTQNNGDYQDESHLNPGSDTSASIRKISGQSVIRNEDFSPIMIGKQSNGEGRVDFAPIEMPVDQLKQKLEALRINQMLVDPHADVQAAFDESGQERSGSAENTEDYARQGGFLNLQRGGRSKDGSFRFRALSPGLVDDSSAMLPEESLQASTPKQFPSVRTDATNFYQEDYFSKSPSMPRAPFPSPEKKQVSTAGSLPSAGSPLKLFGPYDTFTNQTLLRRISQFEEGMSGTTSQQSLEPDDNHDYSVAYDDQENSNPYEAPRAQQRPPLMRATSVSQFGGGDLEGYEFSEDLSYVSHEQSALGDAELPSHHQLPSPPTEPIFQVPSRPVSPDEESELVVRRRRNKSVTSSSSKQNRTISTSSVVIKPIIPAIGASDVSATPKRDSGSEGKRQRTSPSKDPTPKRRRTLHKSDIAFGREEQFAAVDTAHRQMQSAMGKKRKDARPGEFQLANPDVLAMRSILRPRTPTPSQRSSQQREEHPFADGNGQLSKSPIRALQNENMPLASNASTPGDVERKPSIRTQDFVDQAALIMAMIRNQVRPPGLASVEESEAENGTPQPEDSDDSYQESTKEPFSRPPSREGRPLPRPPMRQEDPELLKRLKKYQEMSDMGDLISSSLRSMNLVKDAIRAAQEVERQIEENSRTRSDAPYIADDEIISDPPNMRISINPSQNDQPGSPNRDFPSHSSGFSTSHSFPTGSSRGSESRKTIMPESISHLIPDRVGSMFLDKQNNIWIKKKEQLRTSRSSNILPSEDSEDDPFASIPDLSVDMTKEMQNLLLRTAQKDFAAVNPEHVESPASPTKSPNGRPNRGVVTVSPSSPLSPDVPTLVREGIKELDARVANAQNEEDEDQDQGRETSMLEDGDSNPTSTTRRRNLTITFSSPIASIIHDVVAEDLDSLDEDAYTIPTPKKSPGYGSVGKSALKNPGQGSVRSNRAPSRQFTSNGPAFIPRPVSRIDEQDEESTIEIPIDDQRQMSLLGETSIIHHKSPDGRRTSLSFIVNRTPASNVIAVQNADDSALIGQNVGKLSLSPLSEFTLNNSDQSFGFEVSYVMGRRHLSTGDGSKKVMSMTIRDLVDKLSEVEPFEPYWEDMTELDLGDKRLGSLHMLDEFCGKLITLDASKNALGHLDGVPSTVRQLKVSFNMLTELTSWDHLMNLQYVDVSGNELKSLSALKNLVHLRNVKADDNQLTSLDGLELHDGILSLRARNNLIEEVDGSRVQMSRLTDLDLENNQITSIHNLEMLPSLSNLKLGNNKLHGFTIRKILKSLRHLDVSDNVLTSLDIGALPNLHSLHADRNRITEITGFIRARRLDSLSLREQRGDGILDLELLSQACEVRKLFLSGNYLGAFEPTVDFLNLQLLEVANCGLQHLPENLGQLMPNLRTLNLSFNAIGDLSPLRFIPRMKKLLIAGNRLADSTAVTELLTDFPHLTQLDLRDNPVTIGFYPPVQVLVPAGEKSTIDPFTLPKADIERDDMFASRLDEATRLRRRLHHIVFVASCKRLRTLDGLSVSRSDVLAKDDIYQMLVAEGLLPDETLVESVVEKGKDDSCHKMANETKIMHDTNTLRSSRWNAEDSFA